MDGIVLISLVPLRVSNSEQSEMSSQLLYGERVEIIEAEERWLHVRNMSDNYTGWVDRKMIHMLTEIEKETLSGAKFHTVQVPLSNCDAPGTTRKVLLPGGSLVPYVNSVQYQFSRNEMQMNHADIISEEPTGKRIVFLAKQYLNAPYLWGGKTILGMDCSGLVQLVHAMCGVYLPRDAAMQAGYGNTVSFLSEAKAGDLAFFENKEGKITHTGILLSPHEIIHASGQVKIDSIDSEGIISRQTGGYRHKLRMIKRL